MLSLEAIHGNTESEDLFETLLLSTKKPSATFVYGGKCCEANLAFAKRFKDLRSTQMELKQLRYVFQCGTS